MLAHVDFLSNMHKATKRDYRQRVIEHDKAQCATVAKKYDQEYWDGDRKYGYGGFHYDGRWASVARDFIAHYQLKDGHKVLDIGCGKAFLLYELKTLLPGLEVYGVDLSDYALIHAKKK